MCPLLSWAAGHLLTFSSMSQAFLSWPRAAQGPPHSCCLPPPAGLKLPTSSTTVTTTTTKRAMWRSEGLPGWPWLLAAESWARDRSQAALPGVFDCRWWQHQQQKGHHQSWLLLAGEAESSERFILDVPSRWGSASSHCSRTWQFRQHWNPSASWLAAVSLPSEPSVTSCSSHPGFCQRGGTWPGCPCRLCLPPAATPNPALSTPAFCSASL